MRAYDIIKKKRDGGGLTKREIAWFVKGYTDGAIPEYQASALLMAVFYRGMNDRETLALTEAMLKSGTVLDLSNVPGVKVDKHSTGGVGDKVSLILSPLAAAAGLRVPMLSGRGLGHTGGTLDKLCSIPGFSVDIPVERFVAILKKTGAAMIGQTEEIAPADRKLYALRDVTATVESIPLIAASIMSKKLAEGIDALVLDVKTGSGAFMKSYEDAEKLSNSLVSIGRGAGKKTAALITDMDQPLGRAVGNALEVKESVLALMGVGPADLTEVTVELTAMMLKLAGVESDIVKARKKLAGLIRSGVALKKFFEMVEAQGGDVSAVRDPSKLPKAKAEAAVRAARAGVVQRIDAEAVGISAMVLGAGRERSDDVIDPAAGIYLNKKVGDKVRKGEVLAVMHVNDARRKKEAGQLLENAFTMGGDAPEKRPLVYKVIE